MKRIVKTQIDNSTNSQVYENSYSSWILVTILIVAISGTLTAGGIADRDIMSALVGIGVGLFLYFVSITSHKTTYSNQIKNDIQKKANNLAFLNIFIIYIGWIGTCTIIFSIQKLDFFWILGVFLIITSVFLRIKLKSKYKKDYMLIKNEEMEKKN